MPSDQPDDEVVELYARLVGQAPLKFRIFQRDRDMLWRLLDEKVAQKAISAVQVDVLRRDHDGAFTIPLAWRYLATGQAVGVTKWMREQSAFWDLNWVDRSVRGARGSGTLRLFETLRDGGGAIEGAALAAEHLWFRLVGARHHEGLRQYLREVYRHYSPEQLRKPPIAFPGSEGPSLKIDMWFAWMPYIAETLRPIISVGDADAIARLDRVVEEVAAERAKFEAYLAS